MNLEDFYRRLQQLRVNRSSGLVKPYNPILIAAVTPLLHKGTRLAESSHKAN